jgi:hypothetical protein
MRVGMLLFSPVRLIVGRRDLAAEESGEDSPHIHKEHPQGKTGEKIFRKNCPMWKSNPLHVSPIAPSIP